MRAAGGIDAEPIRVSLIEFFGSTAGIHAGQNGDAVSPGGVQKFAKEIAVAEKLSPAVQRILTGVIGDDAASVDDDALNASAFPVIAPPGDVVTSDIEFGDVGLA